MSVNSKMGWVSKSWSYFIILFHQARQFIVTAVNTCSILFNTYPLSTVQEQNIIYVKLFRVFTFVCWTFVGASGNVSDLLPLRAQSAVLNKTMHDVGGINPVPPWRGYRSCRELVYSKYLHKLTHTSPQFPS